MRFSTDFRKEDTPTKTVNSLLTFERNSDGKITRHTEEWDHKRETDSTDGILGWMNESRKTLTAKVGSLSCDLSTWKF